MGKKTRAKVLDWFHHGWFAGILGFGDNYCRIAKQRERILIRGVTAEQVAKFGYILKPIISEIKEKSSLGVQSDQISSPLSHWKPLCLGLHQSKIFMPKHQTFHLGQTENVG